MHFDTFDADHVLSEYGDASTVAELVAIVRTDVAECASSLEQAAGAGDLDRVRDVAHAVKGVAAAVAATLVSELAGRVDTGLRRGDIGCCAVRAGPRGRVPAARGGPGDLAHGAGRADRALTVP